MNDTDQLPRHLRLLKALVIGLGVLLGIAALTVVGIVFWKMSHRPQVSAEAPVQTAAVAAVFGTSNLPIPATCQVKTASADGDRLILLIDGPDDCSRVLVADLRNGKLLGQFRFPAQ